MFSYQFGILRWFIRTVDSSESRDLAGTSFLVEFCKTYGKTMRQSYCNYHARRHHLFVIRGKVLAKTNFLGHASHTLAKMCSRRLRRNQGYPEKIYRSTTRRGWVVKLAHLLVNSPGFFSIYVEWRDERSQAD